MPATINSIVDTVRRLRRGAQSWAVSSRRGGHETRPSSPAQGEPTIAPSRLARLPLPAGAHAGLARVLSVEPDGRPRLRLAGGGEAVAEWAMPFLYEPAVGDQLWIVGKDERVFVLGVAHGRGLNRLAVRGDLPVASGGTLRLIADVKVSVVGKTVALRGRTLKVVARTIHSLSESAAVRVKGLLRLTAGRVQRITAGVESVRARRVVNLGAEIVKIDANDVIGLG